MATVAGALGAGCPVTAGEPHTNGQQRICAPWGPGHKLQQIRVESAALPLI